MRNGLYPMPSGSMSSAPFKPYTRGATPRPCLDPARAPLKRGKIAQALVDIFAIGFLVSFASVCAVGLAGGAFVLAIEICQR